MLKRNWRELSGFLIAALVLAGGTLRVEASVCGETINLEPQGLYVGEATSDNLLFRVPVPSAGVLLVRGSTPADGKARPHLVWLEDTCGETKAATVVQRAPAEIVLRFPAAGTAFFALQSEDPERPLQTYKMQTIFRAEPVVSAVIPLVGSIPASCSPDRLPTFTPQPLGTSHAVELQRLGAAFKDVDPIDCEVVGGSLTTSGVMVVEGDDLLRATVYGGETCSLQDRRTESMLGAGESAAATVYAGEVRLDLQASRLSHYRLGVKFFALCDGQSRDDHADLPLCATPLPLGKSASGRIGEFDRLDEDFFTFRVETQRTVKIAVRSGVQAALTLYDEAGQILDQRQVCTRGCAGRIVRTLGQGRYFLRLGGQKATGARYTLTVR